MARSKNIRIGIDIGTNSVKLASYYTKKKSNKLGALLKFDFLEEDVVKEIREVNETHIMNAIKTLLAQVPVSGLI